MIDKALDSLLNNGIANFQISEQYGCPKVGHFPRTRRRKALLIGVFAQVGRAWEMGVTGNRRNACSSKISLKDHGTLMQELGAWINALGANRSSG